MSSRYALLFMPSMANPANTTSEARNAPFQPSPEGGLAPQIGKDPAEGVGGVYGAYRAV
jgi:hypothetical protein